MNSPPAKRDGKSSYEKPPRKKKRMALRGTKGKHSVASSSGIHKEHQSSKKNTVSPPQKDECFAFMIDPPNGVDSKEIRITRLLENISLKDLWLGQMNAMLITTDGQKYKWYAGTWKPRHPRPVTQWEFHESDYYKSTESRAYLDEEGNVYTQVKNQGQAVPEWTKVEFPPGTSTIIDLVVSGQTFVALSKTGQLLTWGYDHHGSLGSSARAFGSSQERWMPHKVECLESGIRQISGRNSMVAAIKGNQLCTWGSNKEGMLGYFENREGEHYPFECLVQQDSKEAIFADCKEVRCGTNHVVALKNDGVVYAWGMGNKCQLGTWGRTFSATPVRIEINEKIRTINCGSTGSMALAESGNVYVWGSKITAGKFDRPQRLHFFDDLDVQKLECYGHKYMVLTKKLPDKPSVNLYPLLKDLAKKEGLSKKAQEDVANQYQWLGMDQEFKEGMPSNFSQGPKPLLTPISKSEFAAFSKKRRKEGDLRQENDVEGTKGEKNKTTQSRQVASNIQKDEAMNDIDAKLETFAAPPTRSEYVSGVHQPLPLRPKEQIRSTTSATKSLTNAQAELSLSTLLKQDESASLTEGSTATPTDGDHEHLEDDPCVVQVHPQKNSAPSQFDTVHTASGMEVLPNGFTEVHGWMCGRLRALTMADLKRYALGLVTHGYNSVNLMQEMLGPPQLAKCLQDSKGKPLPPLHVHYKYMCKQFQKEGFEEFAAS